MKRWKKRWNGAVEYSEPESCSAKSWWNSKESNDAVSKFLSEFLYRAFIKQQHGNFLQEKKNSANTKNIVA
jgi:hypothetical protein